MDFITALISTPFVIVGWLIIGIVAGDVARRVMGAPNRGCLHDWILGIVGSFVGGIVGGIIGFETPDIGLGIGSLIVAILGAIVLLGLGRVIRPTPRKQS